jgi:hypothetical protein
MSLRFHNPPLVLLARGDQEGADIGGALSIIAMDKKHNLHVVENIFSELSRGTFWKESGLENEFENFILRFLDDNATFDVQELMRRIINSFNIIRRNEWIFYGIAGFESNTFVEAQFVQLEPEIVDQLREAHRRIRNHLNFPMILEEVNARSFINSMFHGNRREFFHYPDELDLFTIFEQTRNTVGYVAGIVCTAQEAANFYIINENIRDRNEDPLVRMNKETLRVALKFINNDVIFPVSWFRIHLGRNAIQTLEKWSEINKNKELLFALRAYLHYIRTLLREEHEKIS